MSKSLLSRASCVYAVGLSVAAAGLLSLGAPMPASAGGCPNEALRTGPSVHLPDCRAYEMVSPPYKNTGAMAYGLNREAQKGYGAMSPDGSTLLTSSITGSFAGATSAPTAKLYATTRTEAGWSTEAIDPPASEYSFFERLAIISVYGESTDGRTTLFIARGPGKPENSLDFYKHEPTGAFVDVGPLLPPTAPLGVTLTDLYHDYQLQSAGMSGDGSSTFFKREGQLYEYVGVGNTTPMLVGVNDASEPISECGTILGGSDEYSEAAQNQNPVSFDGKTVFFTAESGSQYASKHQGTACKYSTTPPSVTELYARVGNGTPGAHTVAISEPSAEDCAACDTEASVRAPATFVGASEDGSKVFFATTQPLLGGDTSQNLYEYDFNAPVGQRIVRVSGGDASVSGPTATVVGHPQVSQDGSHVYFIAQGVLSTSPNRFGQSAQPGANNLYVFERDAQYPGGRTAFVATLSADNAKVLWYSGVPIEIEPKVDLWPVSEGVNVTPDGRFLLFSSRTDLTPDDTSSFAQQLFEYDSRSGTLVRVSVGQNGFNDNGNTSIWEPEIAKPNYVFDYSASNAYAGGRSISANGEYVFFQSADGLTPEALDHKLDTINHGGEGVTAVPAMNVYEYHDGTVSLISSGRDVTSAGVFSNVFLLGTDESGGDVFFQTTDQLVGQDTDDNVDIYDARVGGGFPPPFSPPGCSGESCQGQLGGTPTLLSPGSEFQAGGNPPLAVAAPKAAGKPKSKLAKCRRGFTRGHGRCVKRVKGKRSSTRSKRGRKK